MSAPLLSIVNVSEEPYFWQHDAKNYGPLDPGQVAEYPSEVALHAIKRSLEIDDEAEPVRYRVEKYDPEKHRAIAKITCPFVALGQCDSRPFDDQAALKAHLDKDHFGIEDGFDLTPPTEKGKRGR